VLDGNPEPDLVHATGRKQPTSRFQLPYNKCPFLYLVSFTDEKCKLILCRVFMVCISAFFTNKCMFFTTNNNKENIFGHVLDVV
jgi:hypothetical protein